MVGPRTFLLSPKVQQRRTKARDTLHSTISGELALHNREETQLVAVTSRWTDHEGSPAWERGRAKQSLLSLLEDDRRVDKGAMHLAPLIR